MVIKVRKFKKEICPHCNVLGVVLRAVNINDSACWTCIREEKVINPTGLGWSK